ncbi:MAG: tetratricopeptide repeat protein [Deltaproteobacteria bacterium]|nr:tetratricopeptide repeat protein [Deltaproteobacteria bacterium]
MTTLDLRDTPVSMTDPTALDLLEQAIRQFQSYVGDPVATIEPALEARPDFALGHAMRAAALISFGEQRFFDQARPSVAALEALVERGVANDRERALGAALRKLVDGDWNAASVLFDRALVANPRDVIALQTAHLFDFVRGDALNLRNRISRVLPAWSASTPGYSYVLGFYAFGLEECNQYDAALATANKALELEPADAWAVHAGLHCMEMQGQIDQGMQWLESKKPQWSVNGFAFHNHWHLALLHLDRGEIARVLEIFDRDILAEDTDIAFVLVDASALLWRLHLLGIDVASRMARLANLWEAKLDGERGFYAFNDVHAMLAFAAVGREASMARILHDLESAAVGSTTNAMMSRDVGLPLARGVAAFGTGRYAQCLDELEPVRDIAYRFGGSHAQRDLITLTIIEAARRCGKLQLARHYLNERVMHRPGSELGTRLLARM